MTGADIATIVSQWTHIPVGKVRCSPVLCEASKQHLSAQYEVSCVKQQRLQARALGCW